ncbi:hypothetical protein [Desulfosporosinus sp. FKB]|uniref:hypothetical protein n=1 Tax=Desulfosporosinus sp. FKB TaxID=1969835 RepID=UPI001FA8EAE1|nr:hypothetical protein [Desulfosporosinus sp. FKB]
MAQRRAVAGVPGFRNALQYLLGSKTTEQKESGFTYTRRHTDSKAAIMLSEHPFGTVKWYHGAHYLLCKDIEKATGKLGLNFLAYNLKRAINMVGTEKLVAAMKA